MVTELLRCMASLWLSTGYVAIDKYSVTNALSAYSLRYSLIYFLAICLFYDYIRSRKETADLDAREIDAANSAEQENIGQKMDIYRSLKTLKEIERTCITLFYMEDLSIEKIAGITGIPTGTVKSHLSRGKEKLATYLKQNGYDKN